MENRLELTEKGRENGWVYMHMGGWMKNPESRYMSKYTAATEEELAAAVSAGDFISERGSYVHVGGIMYDWVREQ